MKKQYVNPMLNMVLVEKQDIVTISYAQQSLGDTVLWPGSGSGSET